MAAPMQLWSGLECTVNRVGDEYFDQVGYSGHADRIGDLERFAALDTRLIRYPVLWEWCEPRPTESNFSWADQRLGRLQSLGLEPVVGLLHHGSGPRHTSLLDPQFPDKFAAYAGVVAARYPWLARFTPINEPLTTARFSGLYGHWFPHGRDDRSFVRALLTQCKAIVLAMAAVRQVNPRAELIQTEDMGFTRSTPMLQYQADFENLRRWLSLDLLSGKVDRAHPLRAYLIRAGASDRELGFFTERPCTPDLVGLNYYLTSERFLDCRKGLYPASMHGGNGRHVYIDVEAVRVCARGLHGPTSLLAEACHRYGRPVAITEAHLNGAPDEQIGWLSYIWKSALAARELGADVRAVTVWALLGAFGWDKLVTQGACSYEAGVFDVGDGSLRETPLTHFVRELAQGRYRDVSGWWLDPARLLYEPHESESRAA